MPLDGTGFCTPACKSGTWDYECITFRLLIMIQENTWPRCDFQISY